MKYQLSAVYSGVQDDDENDEDNYFDLQENAATMSATPSPGPTRGIPLRSESLRVQQRASERAPPGGLCAPHKGVSDLTPGNYEEPWDLSVTHRTLRGHLREA